MTRHRAILACLPVLAGLLLAQGATPDLLHFQARFNDAGGNPLNGPVSVQVLVYDQPTAGLPLWTETHAASATNGVVNLLLGSVTPMPANLLAGGTRHLALRVNSDPEMSPRLRLASVPFARRAASADLVDPATAIPAGSITANHLAAGSVGGTQLSGGAVTASHLATGAVGASALAPGAVGTGALAGNAVGTAQLTDGAVTAPKLAAQAVATAALADGSVTAPKLAPLSVGTASLGDGSVTASKIAPGAVSGPSLASDAVTSDKIADGSVAAADIAASSIGASHLAAGAVTSTALASNSVTSAAIASNTIAAGDIGLLTRNSFSSPTLDVEATGDVGIGVRAVATYSSGTGLYGEASSTGGATSQGVHGKSASTAGRGVLAQATAATGSTYGVYASSASTSGRGIYGHASATTGSNYGVYGETESTSGIGVYGFADASSGTTFGVYGRSDSPNGTGVYGNASSGIGVRGSAYGSITNTAVKGVEGYSNWGTGIVGITEALTSSAYGVKGEQTTNSPWAVYAEGRFGATGTKSFVQPHPKDPSKEVRFVCLEGNESGTYFRGSCVLVNGTAVIEVPEDFRLVTEARGLTIQITPKGPATVWVASEDLDRIVVRGTADVRFDYLVNGVRRGYADFQTIAENQGYVPKVRGKPYGTQYPDAVRKILVENGTLDHDFRPNEATAARLGWKLLDEDPGERAERESRTPSMRAAGEATREGGR